MNNKQFYEHLISSIEDDAIPALSFKNNVMTYRELFEKVDTVSSLLGDKDYWILNGEKSFDYIILLLACIKKGIPFVPVASDAPEERVQYIQSDLENNQNTVGIIRSINELKQDNEDLLNRLNEQSYVIFTSGSTGQPKGVCLHYKGLYNIIKAQCKAFKIKKGDRFLWILSTGFDASLSDIFVTLFSNATLTIPSKGLNDLLLTQTLYEEFNEQGITVSDIPPSVLNKLAPENFKTLERIVVGGEVASIKTFQKFYNSGITIYNVYGPTEATICTSLSEYNNGFMEGEIGAPVSGIDYKVSKEGELLISGIGLASGYTNSQITNSKFIRLNGERVYKTGDLVEKINEKYIFRGRIDRQFKKNGQLICPEEIEKTLLGITGVLEATVHYNGSIHALVSIRETSNLDPQLLRERLRKTLPDYMLPNSISFEKELEKNANDKVIFKKNTEVIDVVKSIFEQTLKTTVNDLNERFYNLGGDSLLFMDVILGLEEHYEFDVMDILQDDSVSGIARVIEKTHSVVNKKPEDWFPEKPALKFETVSEMYDKKRFLLTGATGFLGAYLLADLLKSKKDVVCLVRGSDAESARQRISDNMKSYGLEHSLNTVDIVLGDLTKPDFNLAPEDLTYLNNNVTDIIHAAALVNNLSSLDLAINSNVNPSKTLLEMATTGIKKTIHNVSTLSVFVSSTDTPAIINEQMSCTVVDFNTLYTAYAKSKWLNEYYLDTYKESVNVVHYRLGLLTPALSFPYFKEKQYVKEVFEILLKAPRVNKNALRLSFDLTPVDLASSSMVKWMCKTRVTSSVIHVTSDEKVSLEDLKTIFNLNINEQNTSSALSKFSYELNGKNSAMNIFETTRVKTFSPSVKIDVDKKEYIQEYKRGLKNV